MLGRVRATLDRATWRERGFDLEPDEIARIEGFFRPWFEVYRRPGVGAYDSQEAIFGVHHEMTLITGEATPGRETRWAVSALRAGCCVASVECGLGMRLGGDDHLRQLFSLMETDERWPAPGDGLARAIIVGKKLGEVAERMAVTSPPIAADIPGFDLREAVFADLRATLLGKLVVTSFPVRFDRDVAEVLMRFGHAVRYAEESLYVLTARHVG
jgi:hypothetical protein